MRGKSIAPENSRLAYLCMFLALVFGMVGVLAQITPVLADTVKVNISAPAEVAPDGNFTVAVNITQVTNLDACNYDVSFNTAVLRLVSVSAGNIGGSTMPVDLANQSKPGIVTIVQNPPGMAGISGSGYLALLNFYVIGKAGSNSDIGLSNGVLGDTSGQQEIPATWTGSSVRVVAGLSGSQSPPAPPSSPGETIIPTQIGTNTTETATQTTQNEVTSNQTSATAMQTEGTSNQTGATTSIIITQQPTEVPYGEEEVTPAESQPSNSEVAKALSPPASKPSATAGKTGQIYWPVLGGVIGGGILAIGLWTFLIIRGRSH